MMLKFQIYTTSLLFTCLFNVVFGQSLTNTKSSLMLRSSAGRNYIVSDVFSNPGMIWDLGLVFNVGKNLVLSSSYTTSYSSGSMAPGQNFGAAYNIFNAGIGINKMFLKSTNKIISRTGFDASVGVALINSSTNYSSSSSILNERLNMSFFSYKLSANYYYNITPTVNAFVNAGCYFTRTNYLDGYNSGKLDRLFSLSLGLGFKLPTNDDNAELTTMLNQAINEQSTANNELLIVIEKLKEQQQQLIEKVEKYQENITQKSSSDKLKDSLKVSYEDIPLKNTDTTTYAIKYPNKKYNVVFGGFFKMNNAVSQVESLQKRGVNANLFWKGDKSKLVFIVLFSSNSYPDAQDKVRLYRKRGFSDVWLYTSNASNK